MNKFIGMSMSILCMIIVAVTGICIFAGYDMYKDAVENISIEEEVQKIKEKENYTKIEEIPQIYINAVIAVEDHRFYSHNGVDIIAIGRAVVNDIKALDFVEGGSTITQQLSKNIYFTQEKKITRKIAEVFMSFDLESRYDKKDILELYINTSYYGDGYYTLKEACRGYFNKEISQMTDYECLLLAGVPNAPSVYAPTKNIELTKQRQKQVIKKMIEYGYLNSEEADKLLKQGEDYNILTEN